MEEWRVPFLDYLVDFPLVEFMSQWKYRKVNRVNKINNTILKLLYPLQLIYFTAHVRASQDRQRFAITSQLLFSMFAHVIYFIIKIWVRRNSPRSTRSMHQFPSRSQTNHRRSSITPNESQKSITHQWPRRYSYCSQYKSVQAGL